MTLRKIAQIGHPVLRQTVLARLSREELATPETQRFIDDLIETMRDADGAGLAAPRCTSRSDDLRHRGARQPALPVQARGCR
jgi:peptide deformylase